MSASNDDFQNFLGDDDSLLTATDAIVKLTEVLSEAQHKYHADDNPELKDEVYDQLLRRARDIVERGRRHNTNAELTTALKALEDVTNRVGAPVEGSGLKIYRHAEPMLSLGNAFNLPELLKAGESWGVEHYASYKADGMATNLRYVNGHFVMAATRGDGTTGEVITSAFMKHCKNIPHYLKDPRLQNVEIRGETVILNSDFQKAVEFAEANDIKSPANPRNMVAGQLRRIHDKGNRTINVPVYFYPYGAISTDGKPLPFDKHHELMYALMDSGFEPVVGIPLTAEGSAGVIEKTQEQRALLPYAIDGLVFRCDDIKRSEGLGSTSSVPRWGIAYKFPAEKQESRISDIIIQTGRTGRVTPVAIIEPIAVGGVIVTNATLHNEDHINRLDVNVGDLVEIQRAGDVVPEIVRVIHRPKSHTAPWAFPSRCTCGNVLVRKEGEAQHQCTNLECPERVLRKFEHFVSRDSLDIEGMAGKLLERLLNTGKIAKFADIFTLTAQDILDVTTESSQGLARNILKAIDDRRKVPLERVLIALGIPQVGKGGAKRLVDALSYASLIQGASIALLKSVRDVGHDTAVQIKEYFKNDDELTELLKVLDVEEGEGVAPQYAEHREPKAFVEFCKPTGFSKKDRIRLAQAIETYVSDVEQAKAQNTDLTWVELVAQAEHGPASLFRDFPDPEDAWDLLCNYVDLYVVGTYPIRSVGSARPLDGLTYVITGGFATDLGSRDQISQSLMDLGATVTGSVSKKTTCLIVGDSPGASKVTAAEKHGVPKMTEQELRELLSKHSK